MVEWLTETLLLDDSPIILKYNVFIDRAPCTKLHKRKQKDRTKTLEFSGVSKPCFERLCSTQQENEMYLTQSPPALILSVSLPHRDLSMNIFSTSPEFLATINDIRVQLLNKTCNGVNNLFTIIKLYPQLYARPVLGYSIRWIAWINGDKI
jgi:hypothetical protein